MNATQGAQELELVIRTSKARFSVGERIDLEISLHNTASVPIKTPTYFMLPADDPRKNNLEIEISDVGGNRLSRIGHVMTGRAVHYPEIRTIKPGETYRDSKQIAGTFIQARDKKKIKQALWSFGENPEVTSVNEYPPMAQGSFMVRVVYRVNQQHLTGLEKAESSTVWKGQLISNMIEVSIE